MSKTLSENVGEVMFDNLIASHFPAPEVFSVTIVKDSASQSLKRGTVLAYSSGTGGSSAHKVLGTTAGSSETLTADAILAEDVEVGISENATALAYRTGHFNKNALIVKQGYTFKETDKIALRDVGILLSDNVPY